MFFGERRFSDTIGTAWAYSQPRVVRRQPSSDRGSPWATRCEVSSAKAKGRASSLARVRFWLLPIGIKMDALDFMGFSLMRDTGVVVVEKIPSHFTCRSDAWGPYPLFFSLAVLRDLWGNCMSRLAPAAQLRSRLIMLVRVPLVAETQPDLMRLHHPSFSCSKIESLQRRNNRYDQLGLSRRLP